MRDLSEYRIHPRPELPTPEPHEWRLDIMWEQDGPGGVIDDYMMWPRAVPLPVAGDKLWYGVDSDHTEMACVVDRILTLTDDSQQCTITLVLGGPTRS